VISYDTCKKSCQKIKPKFQFSCTVFCRLNETIKIPSTKNQISQQIVRFQLCISLTTNPGYAKHSDTTVENVLVIEYWDLRFICYLVFVIWNFTVLYDLLMKYV